MPQRFHTTVQEDDEGLYIILPPWSGFEADIEVGVERCGDCWILSRKPQPQPADERS